MLFHGDGENDPTGSGGVFEASVASCGEEALLMTAAQQTALENFVANQAPAECARIPKRCGVTLQGMPKPNVPFNPGS